MMEQPQVRIRAGSTVQNSLLNSLPPLALYIHVPWCVRKCPYCDFNSHQTPDILPEAQYLEALKADLEQALPLIWGRPIVSVFIGGGTPSLLSGAAVADMLSMVRAYLPLLPTAEITLEANPGTVEAHKFKAYGQAGVNRLSLGIQSFNDHALHALGRIHDSAQAKAAIGFALDAVERVNLDVMYALPQQSVEHALEDIKTALSYDTKHLSLYHLTLEPNTVFAKYPPVLPNDDDSALMQDAIIELTAEHGYEHYEVSAYAKPSYQAEHNRNYWEFGDYLGIGPGAHSKLSFPDRILRQSRLRNPQTWMEQALLAQSGHLAEHKIVELDDLPFEFMLNALRLRDGVPADYFEDRTGQPLTKIVPTIRKAIEKGLIDPHPSRIRTTDLGWRFLTDVQEMFLE